MFGAVATKPAAHVSEQNPGDAIVTPEHVTAFAIVGSTHGGGGGIGCAVGGGIGGSVGGGVVSTHAGSGVLSWDVPEHITTDPVGMYPDWHISTQYPGAAMVTWLHVVAKSITGVMHGGGGCIGGCIGGTSGVTSGGGAEDTHMGIGCTTADALQ